MAQFRAGYVGYVDDREQALKRHRRTLRTPSPTKLMRSTTQAASSSSAAPVQEVTPVSRDDTCGKRGDPPR